MFNKKNNKKEVIEMEQTTFLKKHAGKIIFAGGILAGGTIIYLLRKHGIEMSDMVKKHEIDIRNHDLRIKDLGSKLQTNTEIAVETLTNTIDNYEFEIQELIFKRDNLDQNFTQNIFINIPKLNEEIALKTQLKEQAEKLLEKAVENSLTE